MQQHFVVEDMTCGHCAGRVRAAICALDPHAAVTVDLSTHTVVVESSADRESIRTALDAEGYPPN